MKPEIHARLTIHGEFDPQVATIRLGMEPDWTVRKGESWYARNSARLATNDVWSSRWANGDPMRGETYVEDLIDTFWPKRDNLRGLVEEIGVGLEVSVAVYVYDEDGTCETPSMHLGSDLLKRISELGAEIDFDHYFMEAPDEAEETNAR